MVKRYLISELQLDEIKSLIQCEPKKARREITRMMNYQCVGNSQSTLHVDILSLLKLKIFNEEKKRD